ncbi:UNVERIFIED_CONTAM: hypothetical protein Sindi_0137800 [Sesamum indicum]
MSSSQTSNTGSHSASTSSTPLNTPIRPLVPRIRSGKGRQIEESDPDEVHTYENYQSMVKCSPWMGISTVTSGSFCIPHSPSSEVMSMQLSPNSIRHIILFIIIMRVHRFESSFDNFWSLYSFTTSKRSANAGFFYLSARKDCRFLDPLTSNVGPWKKKYSFVRPPPGCSWPFSLNWVVEKPKPITGGGGLEGDQIGSLTSYRYDPKKILVEEVLRLENLTPAPLQVEGSLGDPLFFFFFDQGICIFIGAEDMVIQAHITQRIRAAQARAAAEARAAQAAQSSTSSTLPEPTASATPEVVPPRALEMIEVGSEEMRSRAPLPYPSGRIDTERSQSGFLRENPTDALRKRKERGKSPIRPDGIVQSRSIGPDQHSEVARIEEEKNMDLLKRVTECWRKAREDLRSPYHLVAELEGDKWVPDWKISPSSTVFKTHSGQDSWELGLSLKCSGFRQNQLAAERRSRDLRIQLFEIATRERESDKQRSSMEARIKELENQMVSEVARAHEEGEKVGFDAGHATRKIAGVIEGREVFLRSEEFSNRVRETRLQAARDFLKAPTFESALEIKAAEFLMRGFDRCKAQVSTLNGFASGFDTTRLDPGLDGDLQPFPEEEAPPVADDEFAILLEKLDEN